MPGPVIDLAVTPLGRRIIARSVNDVRVFDVATGQRIASKDPLYGAFTDVRAVSRNGRLIAGSLDAYRDRFAVADARTGRVILRPKREDRTPLRTVELAPDGTVILTRAESGLVDLWDLQGHRQGSFMTYAGGPVIVAAGGRWVGIAGSAGVRIWDPVRRSIIATLPEPSGAEPVALALSPDGEWFATVAGNILRVWSAHRLNRVAAIQVDGLITGCAWSAAGDAIAAVGAKGIYVFRFHPPRGEADAARPAVAASGRV
jgi:WD40 repeat protein